MVQQLAGSSLINPVDIDDDLYSGHIRSNPMTIAAGTYARGDVLEIDTATDKLSALVTAAKAFAIMPFTLTLAADQLLAVYTDGDFNEEVVGLNGVALAPTKTALSGRGINLRKWGAAPDAA
ncbi:hypothetical protein SAMN05444339_10268 [Loktanella atrilutea]|uniref:Bacteriophage lambda head decoration protein D n=1 Tax=Loktanella atrilutea TaxID=366533 RepID=A0A1M4WD19_LOKAT|nr:hypothetical protein [Loktanella atrilutea]SHE78963.1 hypothetical protein SAMN05444339_10268 [Loktanella atrilutea]